MIKITAATIQVQMIEFVTGNPKTVNRVGAAAGTFSAADSVVWAVAFDGLEIAPPAGLPGADGEDDCAFTLTAENATKRAQTKMMELNCFTSKTKSGNTNPRSNKPGGCPRQKKLPYREKIHKPILAIFRQHFGGL
jgi:hypothetical protein